MSPRNVNIGEKVNQMINRLEIFDDLFFSNLEMEMDESRACIEPVLLAEQDRIALRQYRVNRDEETKLMSEVPGWEVGTWFGEKSVQSSSILS